MGQLTLKLANLSVSGVVVDTDDKPVEGADINSYGEGQPNRHRITSDAEGKFTIENICEGRLRVSANVRGQNRLRGNVETEGGATDVKIVVSESSSSGQRFVPKEPPSLTGKPLPEMEALGLNLDPNQSKDKMILMCFWDVQSRPSRNCMKKLAEISQELTEKGVIVVAVQASKVEQPVLDEWVQKYKISFAVGMITGDEEKVKLAWGVRGLPWLILTDQEHVVKAEGFARTELEGKLKEIVSGDL